MLDFKFRSFPKNLIMVTDFGTPKGWVPILIQSPSAV